MGAAHPGLEELVREQLKRGTRLAAICELVKERFGESIALSTLHSYWQRRFAPDVEQQRKAYQQTRARVDVLMEEMKGGDKDAAEIVRLLVQSQIFERSSELASADPMELVKEDRRRAEAEGRMEIERGKLKIAQQTTDIDRERLEKEKKELELKVAQYEARDRQAKEEIDEAEQKLGKGESLTVQDINRIRERVFGLAPLGGESVG